MITVNVNKKCILKIKRNIIEKNTFFKKLLHDTNIIEINPQYKPKLVRYIISNFTEKDDIKIFSCNFNDLDDVIQLINFLYEYKLNHKFLNTFKNCIVESLICKDIEQIKTFFNTFKTNIHNRDKIYHLLIDILYEIYINTTYFIQCPEELLQLLYRVINSIVIKYSHIVHFI